VVEASTNHLNLRVFKAKVPQKRNATIVGDKDTLRTIVGDQEKMERNQELKKRTVLGHSPHILLLQEYSLLIQEHLGLCATT
jgi:hypothetical protein